MKHTIIIVCLLCIAFTLTAQAERNKEYKMDIPVLALNPERQVSPEYIYYSAFSPYRDSVKSYMQVVNDSVRNQQRWYVTNKTLLGLYQTAAHGNGMVPMQRILLEVKDSSAFLKLNQYGQYEYSNQGFCYESVLPGTATLKQRCNKMLSDLDNYFGYESRFEKKKVKVWVLKRREQIHIADDTVKVVGGKNYYMAIDIFMAEAAYYGNRLVFNESGIPGTTKIIVNQSDEVNNLPVLNKGIERLGIYFEEEEREMKMLVISERK